MFLILLLSRYTNIKMEKSIISSDCDTSNTIKIGDCLTEFVANRMNCSILWSSNAKGRRICRSKEDYDTFFEIVFDMNNLRLENELENFGCKKKNCIENNWIFQNFPGIVSHHTLNISKLTYYMLSNKVYLYLIISTYYQ
jgi:hypothetical protein